ncbi:S8 family serine peptidase [Rhizobium ruizarguesonis]
MTPTVATFKCLRVIAGTLGLISSTAWSQDASPNHIYVRLPSQVAPNTVAAVAEVGKKTNLTIPAGEKIATEIARMCGSLDLSYAFILADENKIEITDVFLPVAVEKTVVFPACVKTPALDGVLVGDGDTVGGILKQYNVPAAQQTTQRIVDGKTTSEEVSDLAAKAASGNLDAKSPGWRKRVVDYVAAANAREIAVVNGLGTTQAIKVGDSIKLPIRPEWTAVAIDDGISRADAEASITAALERDNLYARTEVVSAASPNLVTPLSSGEAATYCGKPVDDGKYPFDQAALIDMLARIKFGENRSTIMVLDTGTDLDSISASEVPDDYRGTIAPIEDNDIDAPPPASLVGGYNIATGRNSPSSDPGYANRWHGLGVYGAAIGSGELKALRALAPESLKLNAVPVSLVKPVGTGFDIDITSFEKAVQRALDEDSVSTVNISFMSVSDLQMLANTIQRAGTKVVVTVAAGNDKADLETSESWPAIYGGNPANANGGIVITVGSHDRDGKLAGFSRRGWKYVDILAPGCNVPSFTMRPIVGQDGRESLKLEKEYFSGTSASAPLVSFASALLQAEGLNGAKVKSRIIRSADVSSDLDKITYSRGRLNIVKALAIDFDVLEVPDPGGGQSKLILGKLTNPNAQIKVCGQAYQLKRFAKLAFDKSKNPPDAHIWLKNQNVNTPQNMERVPLCQVQPTDSVLIEITEPTGTPPSTYALSDFTDFIAKK